MTVQAAELVAGATIAIVVLAVLVLAMPDKSTGRAPAWSWS